MRLAVEKLEVQSQYQQKNLVGQVNLTTRVPVATLLYRRVLAVLSIVGQTVNNFVLADAGRGPCHPRRHLVHYHFCYQVPA